MMNNFTSLLAQLQSISIAILIAVILIYCLVTIKKRRRHGSSLQYSFLSSKVHGIVFGRDSYGRLVYSPTSREGSCFVVGQPGSGKTSALLIPTLRSWTGSSLTIDISGDISSNVDCPNKLIFAPGTDDTLPYNVFGYIDSLDSISDQDEALENLGYLLMPDQPDASSNAKYFQDGGRSMLIATLIAFYHQGSDFCDICSSIVDSSFKTLLSKIDKSGNPRAISYINQFEGALDTNSQGCKQNADNAVRLFSTNPAIRSALHRPGRGEYAITPTDIESHNVFIVIPDQKLKIYAPLLSIITSQAFDHFSNRPNGADPTILLCLDEFHSLGKLPIGDALRKLRKKNVRIMVLTQSINDIDEVYGRDAHKSMIDNFAYKVILGAGGSDTQEYFSRMIGMEQREKKSYTKSGGLLSPISSETTAYSNEYIVSPADLGRLGSKLILLHPSGYDFLKKNHYFKPTYFDKFFSSF